MVEGAGALYLERGGRSLQMLPAAEDGGIAAAALGALRRLVDDGRFREIVIGHVDGEAVAVSRWRASLEEVGFVAGYRGHVLRPATRRVVAAGRGLAPETADADNYWRRGNFGGSAGTSGDRPSRR
jgi:NADPH-dependent ferric siderophore reductase